MSVLSYPTRRPLCRKRTSELVDSSLRSVVSRLPLRPVDDHAGDRPYVHDRASPAGDHGLAHYLAAEPYAVEVDREHRAPAVGAHLEGALVLNYAGVVHEDVYGPEMAFHGSGHRFDVVIGSDVACDRHDLQALAAQFGGSLLALRRVARADRHLCPRFPERPGEGLSEAAPGARHERHSPSQAEPFHHVHGQSMARPALRLQEVELALVAGRAERMVRASSQA